MVQALKEVNPRLIDLADDDEIVRVQDLKGEPLDPSEVVVMMVVRYCSVTGLKETV